MYLIEPKLSEIVKKQYYFKLHMYRNAFVILIFLQMFFIVLGGVEYIFPTNFPMYDFPWVTWISSTNDNVLSVTLIWTIIMGFQIPSRKRLNESFTFVTNRFVHHLSNFFLMLTISMIGGLSVVLSGSAIKMFAYLRYEIKMIESPGFITSPSDFFIRVVTCFAYMMLFILTSYAVTSFIQRSQKTIVFFAIGWIVLSSVTKQWNGPDFLTRMTEFFFNDSNLVLFLIKIVLTVTALFIASVAVTNRLEVKNV